MSLPYSLVVFKLTSIVLSEKQKQNKENGGLRR